jgi:hypothetical protein
VSALANIDFEDATLERCGYLTASALEALARAGLELHAQQYREWQAKFDAKNAAGEQ